ncbi:hypothetical protein diail_10935 [Diaporthe ilicicola]|nr:hypothetical protein diail_10935 [Diaporthe ilicicola]
MSTSSTQPDTTPPATSARRAARRPPKLRSSCDACGAAKVRCDKTQPRCGRCTAGGVTCVYGLSRKFGKAPRKKAPAEPNASGDSASKPLGQNAHAHHHHQNHQNSLSCFPDYRPLSGATNRAVKYEQPRPATSPSFGLEDSLMAFTSHANHHDMFMPSPDNSLDNFNDPFSFAEAPAQSSHHHHHHHNNNNAILRADPRHHGTVDPLDLTFSASDYSSFSEWIQPDDLMHTPDSSQQSNSKEAESAQQMPSSASSSSSSSSHRLSTTSCFSPSSSLDSALPDTSLLQADSHRCQELAYATLDSLSLRQDSIARGEHLTQTMDKVLNRNKQAVDTMRRLLACPCAKSPHLAMLYASITSKVLMWYQLAAGCSSNNRPAAAPTPTWDSFPPLHVGTTTTTTNHHQPTPPLSASSSPSAATFVTAPASPGAAAAVAAAAQAAQQKRTFVVTPMQFSAGAFSVDDEAAQEALRRQLLLSELGKAGNLIDLLCLQGGSVVRGGEASAATAAAAGGAGGPGGEVNDIYSALGTWLKCELNRTVASLQS